MSAQQGFAARIAGSFTYPLNPRHGALIAGAAVLTAIVALFPVGNWLGYYFILLVVARVGFDTVDRMAAGHLRPGDAPDDFPSGGFARPLKYWLILVGMNALVERYARKYGFAAALGMDIVTSLILPGMVIVLAMTRSLRSAFKPNEWWRVAHVAPGAFVALAFLSLGIDQLEYFAGDLFFPETAADVEVEPETPLAPLAAYMGLVTYLWLVGFCMVGAYVHAYREELGAEEDSPSALMPQPPAVRVVAAAESLASRVRADIAKGNLQAAEQAAYDAMRDDPYDAARHALYHEALMAQPDKAKAMAHAGRYLSLLLKAGDHPEALKLFKACAGADASFRPAQPEEVLPFARAARAMKDPHSAVAIVRGFDKANAGHPDIPAVYLFSAQMLAEDLGNGDMARRILEHLLKRYPGHSIAPDAQRYLQSIAAPA